LALGASQPPALELQQQIRADRHRASRGLRLRFLETAFAVRAPHADGPEGDSVEINSATGMIGIPTQEEWGISVRTLLNPRIRIGALVRPNSSDVVQVYQQTRATQ
jgi:hypothetical protein